MIVSNGAWPGWLDANERCPATCQSCVRATWAKRGASAFTTCTTASPPGTASAPPGRKSFCTSTTSSKSRLVSIVGTRYFSSEVPRDLRADEILKLFATVGASSARPWLVSHNFRNRSYMPVTASYIQIGVCPIDANLLALDHQRRSHRGRQSVKVLTVDASNQEGGSHEVDSRSDVPLRSERSNRCPKNVRTHPARTARGGLEERRPEERRRNARRNQRALAAAPPRGVHRRALAVHLSAFCRSPQWRAAAAVTRAVVPRNSRRASSLSGATSSRIQAPQAAASPGKDRCPGTGAASRSSTTRSARRARRG